MSETGWGTTDRVLREERVFALFPEEASRSNVMSYAREKGFFDLEEFYA